MSHPRLDEARLETLATIHTWSEGARRLIDQRLPAALRGTGPGFSQMLDAVQLRVSVSGIRGKSGLTMLVADAVKERGLLTFAKQTGTDPVSYLDGASFPIDRKGNKVRLDETVWELKKFFPFEAAVVENQAIGEYTMRTFNHHIVRPHYLLITNIRRDHQGDIHRKLWGLARAFGRSANPGALVISGEQRADLNDIMRRHAENAGARFAEVSVPADAYVPGIESVSILDRLLDEAFGSGLGTTHKRDLIEGLRERFRWSPTSRRGTVWFHGAEINDVDSTAAILDYLQRDDPRGKVTFVAYFRADRRDRTASFAEYLEREFERGRAESVFMSGPGSQTVASRLHSRGFAATVLPDSPGLAPEFVDRIVKESSCGRIMTIVNAVPPWPRAIAQELAPRQLLPLASVVSTGATPQGVLTR
jgi:gamma-polyglutamate synthase